MSAPLIITLFLTFCNDIYLNKNKGFFNESQEDPLSVSGGKTCKNSKEARLNLHLLNNMNEDKLQNKLLLHICCAPCSAGVVPELKEQYQVTGFFYNPNINDTDEYNLRRDEMRKFAKLLNIPLIEGSYDVKNWKKAVTGLENEPEKGKRCEVCIRMRLLETAEIAGMEGFDLFCTTLTLSPLKNAGMINRIGNEVNENFGSVYLPSDFKKKDGFKKSLERSKEYNLYRQNYCGCSFSRKQKESGLSLP